MKGLLVIFAVSVFVGCDANVLPRFEIRKRGQDQEIITTTPKSNVPQGSKTLGNEKAPKVDNMMVALDTGAKMLENYKNQGIEMIHKAISGYLKTKNNPLFRAREDYNIKPEVVKLNSGQSSLKVELTANSILKAVQDALASPDARLYTDMIARKAAVLYRTIKDEIAIEKQRRNKDKKRANNKKNGPEPIQSIEE